MVYSCDLNKTLASKLNNFDIQILSCVHLNIVQLSIPLSHQREFLSFRTKRIFASPLHTFYLQEN